MSLQFQNILSRYFVVPLIYVVLLLSPFHHLVNLPKVTESHKSEEEKEYGE